jgi:ubiquinone/menaquinone biosynthesis C-methylase UbiE
MNGTGERAYFLGHSAAEVERLAFQNAFYRDTTEAALRRAGLASGMRVLDVGCGGGDVSLIAAQLVGPSGFVLGIDRSAEAVTAARRRVEAEKIPQVHFAASELDEYSTDDPFDALIGRFVLMYLSDPAATLRMLVRHLQPDGIVAFQEMEMRNARGYPTLRCSNVASIGTRPLSSLPDSSRAWAANCSRRSRVPGCRCRR